MLLCARCSCAVLVQDEHSVTNDTLGRTEEPIDYALSSQSVRTGRLAHRITEPRGASL